MSTRENFARAILGDAKVIAAGIPETEQNVLALVAVMTGENTSAGNNPCATTWVMDGGTPFNTIATAGGGVIHVWNYATEADGIAATIDTLLELNEHGQPVYDGILQELRVGNDAAATCNAWALSPWGTTDAPQALQTVVSNPGPYFDAPIGATLAVPPAESGGGQAPPSSTPTGPQEVDVNLPLLKRNDAQTEPDGATKTAQAKLALIGYGAHLGPKGADGYFGAGTEQAVRAFQGAHGLDVDGEVGEETWPAIIDATST